MSKISRRALLVAGGGAFAGGALYARKPADRSGPRDPYFLQMQRALMASGVATPSLVIDRARLNANIDRLMGHLPPGMGYRIVAKSLPSLSLLRHVRERTGSDRLMTFNLPMLIDLGEAMPEVRQLLGKPLPIQAARHFFEARPGEDSTRTIEWLIDSLERLDQYEALARAVGQVLNVTLELDVGLHRGGFVPGEALDGALRSVQSSEHLRLSGFMGYEPHIPAVPELLGWRDRALQHAWTVYADALAQAQGLFAPETMAGLTRNAAGSPTYRYYRSTELANEVSAGSCLVKPSHFDTALLAEHVPASFIAAPVIKAMERTRIPGLEFADGLNAAWDPNTAKTVFIYGGHWLADPVDPPGLQYNGTFGRSSNQEMLNGGTQLNLEPDEFVFFRPTQSEAVFLQFGDILVYEDGAIVDRWPVFPASA